MIKKIGLAFYACFLLLSFTTAQSELLKSDLDTLPSLSQTNLPFLKINGFLEGRVGGMISDKQARDHTNVSEVRLQLVADKSMGPFIANIVSDFVLDPVGWGRLTKQKRARRGLGEGPVDLRQANLVFSPLSSMDVKVGRQIMTWGTGDLIFINDLFAKDFRSFFLGRNNEYLKAPSNMVKISLFSNMANLDIVYTPRFSPDRFIDGQRISFFDRSLNGLRDGNNPLPISMPTRRFQDDELSIRANRSFGAYEGALYYYSGFWKSPAGQDTTSREAIFPKLSVAGASLRGPIGEGIMNIELGYYRTPYHPNSVIAGSKEFRLLVGYEIELGTDFTLGVQYFFEERLKLKEQTHTWPHGLTEGSAFRDLFTVRISKLLLHQDLKFSLFNFFSPTDQDGYLRMKVLYNF